MDSIHKVKTCKKGIHTYEAHLKQCPECKKESKKAWVDKNPNYGREYYERTAEKQRETALKYYRENREAQRENNKRWQLENMDRVLEKNRRWASKNKEKLNAKSRKWQKENPDKVNEACARRRAIKKNAMPSWANKQKIEMIYKECARISVETGVVHHVDHIYPLKSAYMCGLHVETNLQIITAEENLKKGNSNWPGQLDCQRGPLPKDLSDLA